MVVARVFPMLALTEDDPEHLFRSHVPMSSTQTAIVADDLCRSVRRRRAGGLTRCGGAARDALCFVGYGS